MKVRQVLVLALSLLLAYGLLSILAFLVVIDYVDLAAGVLAVFMAGSGVLLSAKGMARLKRHKELATPDLESAYRYRNAGVALGLTGSGLLVFSWQSFLARFINVGS